MRQASLVVSARSVALGFGEGGKDVVGGGAGRKNNKRKLDSHHRHV